jgi:hypothetical protein
MKLQYPRVGLALSTAALLALTACGGDSDTPAATPTTTFSGIAATGAAMAGATVTISCASGSGTATTAATGSYTTSISNATLPCALRAASADGLTVLYSITTAVSTGSQVANITPLTHLLVASLAGTDPATFFSNFSGHASTVTASSVSAAQSAVLTTLGNAGVNITGLTDLIGGTLVGGSGTGYDAVLDAVHTLLASSGTTLAELTNSVAATAPSATADHTARLPASQLLKTAASNCAALRSGTYTVINPVQGSNLTSQEGNVSFDASTLTWTDPNVANGGGQMAATGPCSYTIDTDSYTVSPAGILMGTNTEAGVRGLSIIIPTQTIAVSELAGSWNAIGFQKNAAGTAFVAETLTADISSSGAFTNLVECVGARLNDTCTTSTTTINLGSNSAGGFDWVGSGTHTWTERAFAYRAGSGDLMLVTLGGGGSVFVWTQQRTRTLPTVGQVFTGGSSVRIDNQLLAGTLSIFPFGATVVSVDTAAGSATRNQKTSTGAPDYDDTVVENSPRAGYNFRAAGSTTATDGRTVLIRERTSLPMRGMGVSFQSVPHVSSFQMSVD